MIYLHVRRQHFDRSPSPIDWLPVRQCPQWVERPAIPDTAFPEATPSTAEDAVAEDRSQPTQAPPQRRTSGRPPRKRRRRRE